MRAALLLALVLLSLACTASDKKGIGIADLGAPERIAALNVSWYYTWQPDPVRGAPPEKFVPMLRSRSGTLLKQQIEHFRRIGKVPVLLALNEPNRPKGDNMSVEEVLRAWPQIEPLAERIGSPAPAGVLSSWLQKFHRMVDARGMHFDFVAVHIYSTPDAQRFLQKIDAVYARYHMPIWITEFAVADYDSTGKPGQNRYSEEQVLEFMRAVLPELERRDFVERYAWFGAGDRSSRREQVRSSRLFERDGSMTPLGKYYAQFSWPPARTMPP